MFGVRIDCMWGDRMYIFTCEDKFEDMMCCIFAAWEKALVVGHSQVRLRKEPIVQSTLFDEYIHVEYEENKYQRIIAGIREKISGTALFQVRYALLSVEEDALDSIYRFLIKGFKVGAEVLLQLADPDVMRLFELKRAVGNEAHYFREFARFHSIDEQVYVCHLEPKSNVIEIVGHHFADRMPSEHFVIVDDNRKMAVVHPKDEECYIRILDEEEFQVLAAAEQYNDSFTQLWKTFVDTIAIKQRENSACQRNLFPLWMRKHATEFMD